MAKRISATAYQALREALPQIFWYKRSFSNYLRAAFRGTPTVLAGIDLLQPSKREVADEIVDRLMRDEDSYQDATLRLMLEIASMTSFSELSGHEDSIRLVARAEAAVQALREQTAAHESLLVERQRIDAEREAYAQQAEVQRRFADELAELHSQFLRLHTLPAEQARERGLAFEPFLNSLFALFDLEPRLAYSLSHEQIDGAFTFDTDDYIVEAKWRAKKLTREQADAFDSKVGRKGKNALGLLVSVNGFSSDALDVHSQRGAKFITMDGADLFSVLAGHLRLEDVLARKRRHVNETGECYFPVSRFFSSS